ncbi:hypothetical protein NC651_025181 [Populus alba x Populus x berolinensis]|nr:hypothetical protein NC651_025181 [Populus alba x Populus x berolinensis]
MNLLFSAEDKRWRFEFGTPLVLGFWRSHIQTILGPFVSGLHDE